MVISPATTIDGREPYRLDRPVRRDAKELPPGIDAVGVEAVVCATLHHVGPGRLQPEGDVERLGDAGRVQLLRPVLRQP